jgi:hypothetical protein
MQQIIYLDSDLGYKFADVKNHKNLVNKQVKLTSKGYHIVCVLDVDTQTIVEKSDSFSAHAAFIEKCYPNLAQSHVSMNPIKELIAV